MLMGPKVIFLIVILVGGVIFQIFLSRSESKLPGLILPVISFIYALFMALNMFIPPEVNGAQIFMMLSGTFLLTNIPTLVLLAIYFACRGSKKRKKELEKMNVQDL